MSLGEHLFAGLAGESKMPKKRNRVQLVCPYCGKEFEIIKSRLKKSKRHYCSLKCLSRFTAKERAKKLKIRDYPYKCGTCLYCGKDIIAKNAGFVKKNRVFCSYSCNTAWRNKNVPQTEKQKMLASNRLKKLMGGKKKPRSQVLKQAKSISGENHWNWKGGITKLVFKERNNWRLKEWKRKVFQRDNYTCQECDARSKKGKRVVLNAHHIKRWSENEKLRYDIRNGLTLCLDCHKKTDNYKGKKYKI